VAVDAFNQEFLREQAEWKELISKTDAERKEVEMISSSVESKRLSQVYQEAYLKNFRNSQSVTNGPQIDERKVYFSLPTPHEDYDILKWWLDHRDMLPVLFRLARKCLAIPATSIPVECVWSTAGNVVTKKRASLLPENVSKLVVCCENAQYL
jgi:hypothetical protein